VLAQVSEVGNVVLERGGLVVFNADINEVDLKASKNVALV